MGEIRSKEGGYYILNAQVGAATVRKALMDADIPLEKVDDLPSTDEFYLYIPDYPYTNTDKQDG